jgi:hypothetical protein
MTDLTPEIITGLPAATKARPRSDFRPSEFDQAITTKGYRMWWSRGGLCPCSNNDQTEQPDPTCPLCGGDGYYYFLPDEALRTGALEDSEGNPVQLRSVTDIYRVGSHFMVNADGSISWIGTPPSAQRLTIHCEINPVYLVQDLPNAFRDTQLEGGEGLLSQKVTRLPVHGVAKLDFLVND